MCFGDISASSILLLSYSHFILPLITSPLARKVLNSLYVDDFLSECKNKGELIVFHQKWDIKKDEVTLGLKFNIHTKNRGVAKGCGLTSMRNDEVDKVKVTKTLLAHLLGQIYDLSGILAQIRATLLSLFSKACTLLKDWTTALSPESEGAVSVTAILKELAADLPLFKPLQRCKIPDGATLQRIISFSDASLDVVSFAMYLEVRNADLSSSWQRAVR